MSLGILVAMVVVGLALAIGAVHLSGLSRPARLEGERHAVAVLLADFPDECPREAVLSVDRLQAWLPLERRRIGLVLCFGSKTVTRILEARDVRAVRRDPDTLDVRIADFTLPQITARFADVVAADRVEAMLVGKSEEIAADA